MTTHTKNQNLTAERLRQVLSYDPETGIFTWKIRVARCVSIGQVAGAKNAAGYLTVGVDNWVYRAHRLAWLYMTGNWPNHEIDHINGVRTDNRWLNLRDVDRMTNSQNTRRPKKNNRTDILGVTRRNGKNIKFEANINANGVRVSLGLHDTAEQAHAVYLSAKRQLHEGCVI